MNPSIQQARSETVSPAQPGASVSGGSKAQAAGLLDVLWKSLGVGQPPQATLAALRAADDLMPVGPRIQIVEGDTLSGLARQLGTSVDALMKLNPQIRDANLIYAGDQLRVPEGSQALPTHRQTHGQGANSVQRLADPGSAKPLSPAQGASPAERTSAVRADGPVSDQLKARYGDKAEEVAAFLRMLRRAEGTDRAADPYRVVYGYGHTLKDLSQHPSLTGEWDGELLSDRMCSAAGVSKGCKSKAAGAYQITASTYRDLIHDPKLQAFGAMPAESFGAAMQERMACRLLERCGAMKNILAGNLHDAVHSASGIWASLPGNHYEQGSRSMAQLERWYAEGAG